MVKNQEKLDHDIISFVTNIRDVCERLEENYKIKSIDATVEDATENTETTLEFMFENGLHFCMILNNNYKLYPDKEKMYHHIEQKMKKELYNFIIRCVKKKRGY